SWNDAPPDMMTGKGMPEGQGTSGGGGGMEMGDRAKEIEKHFSIRLVLDQVVEEGRKLPERIEPDPAAGELAGW
ncbi:MAG: hypothetical protein HY720_10845, partial [Planctomycetes bacterium]|nr:hypothetical protein [Planctomycetota bacterium]